MKNTFFRILGVLFFALLLVVGVSVYTGKYKEWRLRAQAKASVVELEKAVDANSNLTPQQRQYLKDKIHSLEIFRQLAPKEPSH